MSAVRSGATNATSCHLTGGRKKNLMKIKLTLTATLEHDAAGGLDDNQLAELRLLIEGSMLGDDFASILLSDDDDAEVEVWSSVIDEVAVENVP